VKEYFKNPTIFTIYIAQPFKFMGSNSTTVHLEAKMTCFVKQYSRLLLKEWEAKIYFLIVKFSLRRILLILEVGINSPEFRKTFNRPVEKATCELR
jgi:hypothetical protein